MNSYRSLRQRITFLGLLLLGLSGCSEMETTAQAQPGPFQRRVEQGVQSAALGEDGVWIAYGLLLPLEPTTLLIQGIPMSWQNGSLEFGGTFIDDLINPAQRASKQLAIAPGDWEGEKVLRRVAVLLGFSHDRELERVLLVNRELPFDLGEREFVWLGEVERSESLETLEGLFRSSQEPRTRQRLLSTVGWHQSEEAARFLRGALGDEDLEVRLEAVRGFRHFPNSASVDLMTRLSASEEELKIRAEAVSILGRMEAASAEDALIGLLDPSDDLKLQGRLVQVLSRRRSEKARTTLLRLIESDAPESLRQEAVSQVARHLDPEVIRPRLERWARSSDSALVRRTAVGQLSRRFLPDATEALLQVIASETERTVVSEAISGLGRLPAEDAGARLGRLAETDSRAPVRLEAVRTLAKLKLESLVPKLERIARNDSETRVQQASVEALRRIPGEASVDSLIRISGDHSNPDIRRVAVREMAQRASLKVSKEVAARARRDPDRKVQAEAVTTLRKLGTEDSIQELVAIAKDHPVYEIRRHAIRELGRSDSAVAKQALIEMARER